MDFICLLCGFCGWQAALPVSHMRVSLCETGRLLCLFHTGKHACLQPNPPIFSSPLLSVFHSEARNICPVHAFTSSGKLWDGCHGSMPPTVVTWCLKATCCCCFLYVAYFPDVGTVGNNDCCCRSNDIGNSFLPFPHPLLTLSPSPDPSSFFCIPLSSVET